MADKWSKCFVEIFNKKVRVYFKKMILNHQLSHRSESPPLFFENLFFLWMPFPLFFPSGFILNKSFRISYDCLFLCFFSCRPCGCYQMDWPTPDHTWSRNSAWTEHTHSGSTNTDCWTEGSIFTIWRWMASCGWEHLAVDKHSDKFFNCNSSTRVGSRLLRNSCSWQVQRWNSNITIHRCTHGNCSSNT